MELIDAGVSHIVLAALPPIPSVRWLAEEIDAHIAAKIANRCGA